MKRDVMWRQRCVLPVVLLVAVVACGGSKGEAADSATTPSVAAATAVVRADTFVETVGAAGNVEARAGHLAAMSAPAATRVARVLVAAGQRVVRGQVLVEFDRTAFDAAAQSANAALTAAQQARARAERLVAQGVAARKDLEQADAEVAKAAADAVAARRIADLATMRAPIDGVVTLMNASLGASVDPSQPLIEIADPQALDVVFTVQPADAARIHVGDGVRVHAGQHATADSLASGNVADIGAVVDSASRTVAVRIHVARFARPLRIGETLFGEIAVATRAHALLVPINALVPEGDGFKVFVVDSAGIAHARPVAVGGRASAVAEVVSGLAPGERIVTDGAYGVEDSSRIVSPSRKEGAPPPAIKP